MLGLGGDGALPRFVRPPRRVRRKRSARLTFACSSGVRSVLRRVAFGSRGFRHACRSVRIAMR